MGDAKDARSRNWYERCAAVGIKGVLFAIFIFIALESYPLPSSPIWPAATTTTLAPRSSVAMAAATGATGGGGGAASAAAGGETASSRALLNAMSKFVLEGCTLTGIACPLCQVRRHGVCNKHHATTHALPSH